MSLIIDAPGRNRLRITSGLQVSTETGTGHRRKLLQHRQHPPQLFLGADRRRAGTRRFAADVEDVGALLDQAPRMVIARLRVEKQPPSENESGVTLTTPMISGRSSGSNEAASMKSGVRREA